MAKKKTVVKTTKRRQRSTKPLPIKAAGKKAVPAKKSAARKKPLTKTAVSKRNKTTARNLKSKRSSKKVIIRQFRVPLGPKAHLLVQLKRTRESRSKPTAKTPGLQRIKRIPLAFPLIIIGVLGTVYFGTDILRPPAKLTVYSPPAPAEQIYTAPEIKPITIPRSEPANLKIPDIGINVSLTSVGRQADNTLEVPVSADVPGWYRHSPTPGELGPSIIVGHVDSPSGPAIFWKLRELVKGQIIEIRRADNTTAKFKITSVLQFEQDNFPTDKVYGNIDHAGLRLITCGGTFNRVTGQYSHNTVIFASLEV